ncbi:exo-beta-N-acetylmuramidase NamZ family protein [Brachybacterium tyrofermentans]|uniref:exo-beta-N-acetylmuramidase NamZ family protein n=1 Tax=Brachybacterium tyrofermentans TaxID=47848 RepID=UPI003FCF0990
MSFVSQPLTGLDSVVAERDLLPPGRIGLLTHFAAVTQDLDRGVDALVAAGLDVRCLISPEHGYWGTGQAGTGNDEDLDPASGLPVLDAYGLQGRELEKLLAGAGIDRVVVDLQDIGCRFYTYMWSMTDVLEACANLSLPLTVLDRPAPMATTALGPGLDPRCASFVGRYGVPLRHGSRLGQIARTIAADHLDLAVDLQVIEAPGADGSAPWIAPSPNMPTLTTVALYPGTGLLEGAALSEGRGTTRPFELFGAPWCGPELTAALRELDLPGVRFREANYRPTHSAFAGERVQGAQVHLATDLGACGPADRAVDPAAVDPAAADPTGFDPLRIGHAILATVAELYPDQPLWREAAPGRPEFIDLLWGSVALREGIADRASYDEILAASPAPIELAR